MKAPVNVINFERATEIKGKIKDIDIELKKVIEDKDYLETELKIMELQDTVGDIGNE